MPNEHLTRESQQASIYREIHQKAKQSYLQLERAQMRYMLTGDIQSSLNSIKIPVTQTEVRDLCPSLARQNRARQLTEKEKEHISFTQKHEELTKITSMNCLINAEGYDMMEIEQDLAFMPEAARLTTHAAILHLGRTLGVVNQLLFETAAFGIDHPRHKDIQIMQNQGYELLKAILETKLGKEISQDENLFELLANNY